VALYERQTGRRFRVCRAAIAGGTPEQDIGNVDRIALPSEGGQHPVQQLSTGADEGQALAILIDAGRFADKHQIGGRITVGEDGIGRREFKGASLESF